jgi:AcrR family transcriptional regulator
MTAVTAVTAAKPLRRDAAENREKVLDAATRVFAERGLDATVDEVAREAGVGVGTLYRRFPHKQALIDELVGSVRRTLLALALEAAAVPDGTGLEQLLVRVGELQAGQPGCLPQLWTHSDAEAAVMGEFRSTLVTLLARAQDAGRVRRDAASTDITVAMWSLRGLIEMTRDAAPDAWRRHLELLVAGLRPPLDSRFAAALQSEPLAAAAALRIATGATPTSF